MTNPSAPKSTRNKTTAAKATPTPQVAAPAPANERKLKPVIDFSALAAKATVAPALPKMGRAMQDNPFVAKVRESFEKQEAIVLPAIPAEALTPVKVAIRRGATLSDLGVSIRETETEDGIVITFMGKTRNKRTEKLDAATDAVTNGE